MERTAWLAERKRGIGSSDAAAVCGVNPPGWRTALHVFADKIDALPQEPEPDDGPLYWGLRHEPVIAAEYAKRTGRVVSLPATPIVWSDRYHWAFASLDRVADDGRIVELKTARTAEGWGAAGTDEVPDHYRVQVAHQMLVTGRMVTDFAVLIGGSDFRVYTVPFSPDLAYQVERIERDFVIRHLTPLAPPPPDWSHEETPRLLAAMKRPAVEVMLGHEDEQKAVAYLGLSDHLRALEKERDALKAELMARIGGPGVGLLPGGGRLTWKTSTFLSKPRPAREESRNTLTVTLEGADR